MDVEVRVLFWAPISSKRLKSLKNNDLSDELLHKAVTQTGSKAMKFKNYIHLRNKTYYFRARYPKHLVELIGRKELSRSLKTDSYQEATSNAPQVMVEYQRTIDAAESKLNAVAHSTASQDLSESQILSLVSDWYQNAKAMYQHDSRAKALSSEMIENRKKFLADAEDALRLKKQEMLAYNQYDSVRPIVAGILKRAGVSLDVNGQSYGLLCQTVLRAWVNLEEQVVERLKGNFAFLSSDNIHELLSPQSPIPPHRTASVAAIKTLNDLITAYTEEHGLTWAKSTVSSKKTVFRFLEASFGKNRPLHEIDREAGRIAFEQLKRLPVNWGKRSELRGLPMDKLIKRAEKHNLPLISSASVNGIYLGFTKPLFDWAVNEQWMERNPFDGLKNRQTKRDIARDKENKRTSFTAGQLLTLFNAEPWHPLQSNRKIKPSFFWGPLIALFHGFRVGEVCGLLTSDIDTDESIPAFILKERFEDDGGERTLKTANATRVIPIHPELITMGFLEFAAGQAKAGHRQLFPECKADANGKWGRQLTLWFNRNFRTVVDANSTCTFHSFRHNFQDAIRDAGLHGTAEGQALGGRKTDYRSSNANSDIVADEYGTRFKCSILLPLVSKIRHMGLDLEHLKAKALQQQVSQDKE
ncbi:DUF6538 domain-containing protein [Paremcibacter congregatus]|uniref:DUF6538 domain-containing protein n=1 Tax=Paremcibacter congregatus TaxID=2043170 RepID=UPI003A90877F